MTFDQQIRNLTILRMRLDGKTYTEIAKEFKISNSSARVICLKIDKEMKRQQRIANAHRDPLLAVLFNLRIISHKLQTILEPNHDKNR